MRKIFVLLLLFIVLFPGLAQVRQQAPPSRQESVQSERDRQYWSRVLDAYESFARQCRQSSGSRKDLAAIRRAQKKITRLLSQPHGPMTAAERARFEQITAQTRFPSGIGIDSLSFPSSAVAYEAAEEGISPEETAAEEVVPREELPVAKPQSPASGKAYKVAEIEVIPKRDTIALPPAPAGMPAIGIQTERQDERLSDRRSSTKAPAAVAAPPSRFHCTLLLQLGWSLEMVFGGMAGLTRDRFPVGAFVSVLARPGGPRASYDCLSNGQASGGGFIWTSGKSATSQLMALGGIILSIKDFPVQGYLGAGYGRRDIFWQDTEQEWARVTDRSLSGFAAGAGVLAHFGRFSMGAGVSTLGFQTLGVTLGAGIYF